MSKHTINIRGKIKTYGVLNFTHVQWWQQEPTEEITSVLLLYEINEMPARLGLYMNMSTRMIVDNPNGLVGIGNDICDDAPIIWDVITKEIEEYRKPKPEPSEPNPHLVQHDAVLSASRSDTALEGVLARISAEVTAEAAARKKRG